MANAYSDRNVPEDDMAHTAKDKMKRPHRATRLRGGIYPVTGAVLGAIVLIGIMFYFW